MYEITGQMDDSLELDSVSLCGAQQRRDLPDRRLDAALSTSRQLTFEPGDLGRQFCPDDHVWQVVDAPSTELRSVAQIEVLGQRIGSPPPGICDAGTFPNACCPDKVQE